MKTLYREGKCCFKCVTFIKPVIQTLENKKYPYVLNSFWLLLYNVPRDKTDNLNSIHNLVFEDLSWDKAVSSKYGI